MQISSQNKTVLVLGDIHQNVDRARKILEREPADFVVCVGDWFDSYFYDAEFHVDKTCKLLKEFTATKNFYTLWGNHDLHYFYRNPLLICSGFEKRKQQVIEDYFYPHQHLMYNKFEWYIWIDDRLCTHAGIHPTFIPPFLKITDASAVSEWLDGQCVEADSRILINDHHWFWAAGQIRGGKSPFGGPVWLDFNEEFESVPGLKQLVGHTADKKIRKHHLDGNLDFNDGDLCVDCNLNEYLIINNGKIQVKKYADL